MDLLIFSFDNQLQGCDFTILGLSPFIKFLSKLFDPLPIVLLIKLPLALTPFLPQFVPEHHLFQLKVNNHLLLQLTLKLLHSIILFLTLLVDLVLIKQQVDFLL